MQKKVEILSNHGDFNIHLIKESKNFGLNLSEKAMNGSIFFILLLLFGALGVAAQETIIFKGKSKIYDVKVTYEKCSDEDDEAVCDAKAAFYLMKKNQTQIFQSFEIGETYVRLPRERQKKDGVTIISGTEGSGVFFDDYNFDGVDDLAISNGNYRPYGGATYEVFLFSKRAGKFVKSEELTELEAANMSVDLNKKLKIIETQTKSGCCWHEKARYRFVGGRLQKFYVFTEDATGGGKWVKLTTERLVRGKWRTTSRRVLLSKYYKN